MIDFSFVLYSLLFFVLFLFLGIGLTILLCPKEWRKYTVFLSPIIGYCFLILTAWFFYSLNFKGTDSYYYWILLLALLLLVGAVIKIWKQKILDKLFSRELIVPLIIVIIVFFAVAFPSLRQEKMNSLSLNNSDINYYAPSSKLVKEFPKNDPAPVIDYFIQSEDLLGPSFETAFFSSVANLEPYQVQNLSVYLFFIFSLLLTYIIGREVFDYNSFVSKIIVLLYGFSSILYYVIYQGFECQIIAMSLMLLIILLNTAIVKANKFKDTIVYLPFLFLTFWALSLTYNHMFVIIYGLIFCYVILSFWKNKRKSMLVNWIAVNGFALILMVLLAPDRLQMIYTNTLVFSTIPFGWFMNWIIPQKLYGITPLWMQDTFAPLSANIYSDVFKIAVTILFALLIITGFVKLFRKNRENFLLTISMFALINLGALVLSVKNIHSVVSGGFGGYNQFKLISFFLPILLLTSFTLFQDMPSNIRGNLLPFIKSSPEYLSIKKYAFYLLIIAVLIVTNVLSSVSTRRMADLTPYVISSDIMGLQVLKNNQEIESINIPIADPQDFIRSVWVTSWEAYFLFPHKLFIEQTIRIPSKNLDGQWTLIRNGVGSTGKYLTVISENETIIPVNSTYSLRKGLLTVTFGKGWSDNQGVSSWTTSNNASLLINSTIENMHADLTLEYWPLLQQNNLSIYLNGVKVADCDNNNHFEIKNLSFIKGINTLELVAKLPAMVPGNGDPRELCYCFTSIQFKQVE